jgi:hypothetical protein
MAGFPEHYYAPECNGSGDIAPRDRSQNTRP